MAQRRGNGSGGGKRRRGRGGNTGRGGSCRMRQSGGSGRHGRSGIGKGPSSSASPSELSFKETGSIKPGGREFGSDNEALIQKLRFIKRQLFKMENADSAASASRTMPGKLTDEEKKTSDNTAVVDIEKCLCCGICADTCPEHAISINGEAMVDPGKCNACGTCISVCPNEAISLSGWRMAANS